MSAALEMVWDDFDVARNCAEVSGRDEARLYLAQLGATLQALETVVGTADSRIEARAIAAYLGRLRHTVRALEWKHFYGGGLKIDPTDSGFVHFSTLLELAADAEQREGELSQIGGEIDLRKAMLERIVKYAEHPRDLQRQAARRLYLTSLAEEKLFRPFISGPLFEAGGAGDERSYFWSFATYDKATSRPFIYLLYFVHQSSRRLTVASPEFRHIEECARHFARGRQSLLSFSRGLDDALPASSLRIVKRLIIGPYFAPGFAEGDGDLGRLLARLRERRPFCLRWEMETLLSDRDAKGTSRPWRKNTPKQIFWIPKSARLAARGVSRLEKFVLLPYWLGQHVEQAGLFPDTQRLVFDTGGTIHGID